MTFMLTKKGLLLKYLRSRNERECSSNIQIFLIRRSSKTLNFSKPESFKQLVWIKTMRWRRWPQKILVLYKEPAVCIPTLGGKWRSLKVSQINHFLKESSFSNMTEKLANHQRNTVFILSQANSYYHHI